MQSNCIAIEPVETPFGRKRAINQSACNKDYSCIKGYCPSFAIVEGGRLRTPEPRSDIDSRFEALPHPQLPTLKGEPYNVVIAGIGGMGVVTIGAVVAVAAHLSGLASTALDVTGLAQKNGAVSSHLRISRGAEAIDVRRISTGMADALIGCDLVVSSSGPVLDILSPGRTRCVVNRDVTPPVGFTHDPDLDLDPGPLIRALADRVATSPLAVAGEFVTGKVLGDVVSTNFFMLGYAFQAGLLPVPSPSILRAIELNGVAVERNKRAFQLGRLAVHEPGTVSEFAGHRPDDGRAGGLDGEIERRVSFLTEYQDHKYAQTYCHFVNEVRDQERRRTGGEELTACVAKNLFKLMAYKDEYEVARLYSSEAWSKQLTDTFEGNVSVRLNLAPQILLRRNPRTGRVPKSEFGPWIFPAFKVLRKMKGLRGTPFDIFGHTSHRRRERLLIGAYRDTISDVLPLLAPDTLSTIVSLAELPDAIRGYGVVKEESIDRAEIRRAELLARLGLESIQKEGAGFSRRIPGEADLRG